MTYEIKRQQGSMTFGPEVSQALNLESPQSVQQLSAIICRHLDDARNRFDTAADLANSCNKPEEMGERREGLIEAGQQWRALRIIQTNFLEACFNI